MAAHGFVKVSSMKPKTRKGEPLKNMETMRSMLENTEADIAVFPELSLTSYMCEDLFFQHTLQEEIEEAVEAFLFKNTFEGIVIFGVPVPMDGNIYNTAIVVQGDMILGIVPKMHLPNLQEFREKRWFTSGSVFANKRQTIDYMGREVPFGSILFKDGKNDVKFGVEICEDLWTPYPPGTALSMRGADIIFNLSACDAYIGKRPMRKRLVLETSRRNAGAYVFCNVSPDDSSERYLFTGHDLIAQCGSPIKEGDSNTVPSGILTADIDIRGIRYFRSSFSSFRDGLHSMGLDGPEVRIRLKQSDAFNLEDPVNPFPFLPIETEEDGFQTGLALHKEALRKSLRRFGRKSVLVKMDGSVGSLLALFSALDVSHEQRTPLEQLNALLKQGDDPVMDRDSIKETLETFGVPYTEKISIEASFLDEKTLVIEPVSMSRLAFEKGPWLQASRNVYHLNGGVPSTLIPFLLRRTGTYGTLADHPSLKSKVDALIGARGTRLAPFALEDFTLARMLKYGDAKERAAYLAAEAFHEEVFSIQARIEPLYQTFKNNQDFIRRHLNSPKIIDISLNDFYFVY